MKTDAWPMAIAIGMVLTATPGLLAAQEKAVAEPSPTLVAEGKTHYNQFCKTCHGVNMVNAGTSSYDLRTFPRDDPARFRSAVVRGKNTMPAWGDLLKPEEIDAIWAYVLTGGKAAK